MSKRYELLLALAAAFLLCFPAAAQEEATQQQVESWVMQGKALYDGSMLARKNHLEARELFEKAAEHNHPEAFYYLGNLYQNTDAFPKDEDEALSYYYKAANLGHAESQMLVGVALVLRGIKLEPNSRAQQSTYRDAVEWLKKAADQNVAEAQYWYGDMLMKGLGTDKDEARGLALIRTAAEAGNANAQAMLGALYWQGQGGLQKDLGTAYRWMRRSEANGNLNARSLLKRVENEMSSAERTAAKKAMDEMLEGGNNNRKNN